MDDYCLKTLKQNRPKWNAEKRDISEISAEDILKRAGLKKGETFLISAGPPCQSFSQIGNRQGENDPRGMLFHKMIDILKGILPKYFLIENVPGLLAPRNRKLFFEALEELELRNENGTPEYKLNYGIVNAANYGVPQTRKRLFIIGSRSGFPVAFPESKFFEKPENGQARWRSVGAALQDIPLEDYSRKDNMSFNHSQEMIEKMKLIKPGENFRVLPRELLPNCWKNGKHQGQDTFGRLDPNKPSVTIRTAAYNPTKGRYIHPTENRGLSTVEMAYLQTFPSDYRFVGPLVEIGKQIGNAVPPLLAKEIGEAIKKTEVSAKHGTE
jgi:DNA (cytosine-5)-methyltransferase 1